MGATAEDGSMHANGIAVAGDLPPHRQLSGSRPAEPLQPESDQGLS
jgi:hypothetical protein